MGKCGGWAYPWPWQTLRDSAFYPVSSSSVAPSAFASARSVRSEGTAIPPRSIRLMTVAETPEVQENAPWERSRARRNARRRWPTGRAVVAGRDIGLLG